tara:strand:+ start:140 stop:808 length:669 start_codon:yes stop_codon:yes gene_type:complete
MDEFKVLIVDDDDDIRQVLQYNLNKEGFQTETASDGLDCLKKVDLFNPDLILLDVMMPDMDGIEVCDRIKTNPKTQNILICFLTARNEDYSQISGFDAGGDDYVSKPIKPKVLISRIHAILRRNRKTSYEINKSGIQIDREKYIALKDGKEIQLPKKEFELLSLLLSNPNSVFRREVILNKVWGTEIIVGDRTIDVHIRKLREKIGDHRIVTIKGIGYKYVP